MDCTAFGLTEYAQIWGDNVESSAPGLMGWLKFVSPYSPMVTVADIRDHWDAGSAAKWETEHGAQPGVMLALARKYERLEQWDDAERCYSLYLSESPDEAGYLALANIYKKQNHDDRWLATLEEYLRQPDYGLQHAQVEDDIARYYMKKKEYQKAIPFADDGADTGAEWALLCAADAHTGAGDWARAEQLLIESQQGYPDSTYNWFAWCVRTGKGDRKAAFDAVEKYYSEENLGSPIDQFKLAMVEMMQQNDEKAMNLFPSRLTERRNEVSSLHVAVLANSLGKTVLRTNAILQLTKKSGHPTVLRQFAAILKSGFRAPAGTGLDLNAIDELLEKADKNDAIVICNLTARVLDNAGQNDDATKYYRRCVADYNDRSYDSLMAYDALRQRGLDPLALETDTTEPTN